MTHDHIHGRNGNELGVVKIDGTGSHGTKMKLHSTDAAALRDRGFTIPDNNIVERIALEEQPELLFG